MLDQREKYNIPLHLILVFVLLVIGIVTSRYVLYAIQKADRWKRCLYVMHPDTAHVRLWRKKP